jgi:hypothetical protein
LAFNFPDAPTLGQKYPVPAVAGKPVYTWDGEKWTTSTAVIGGKQPIYSDGGQTITGGFAVTPFNIGNFPAALTPDPMKGNYQYGTNNGAFTFNVPAVDCAIDFLSINGASAGTINFVGYTYAGNNYGDALTTTNGHKFIISIRRINGISTLAIKALQ